MAPSSFRSLIAPPSATGPRACVCVQAEFTHAIGVPEGHYLTAGGDVLVSAVVEAPAAGRARPADQKIGRAVPLAVLTLARVAEGFDDIAVARDEIARLHASTEAQHGLIDLLVESANRAARGYRIAARDPYVMDLSAVDARLWRIGLSASGEAAPTELRDSFECPTPSAAATNGSLTVEHLRVIELVSESVADQAVLFEAEDLALRALLDLEHGRLAAAAAQARAAANLLREELVAVDPTTPPIDVPVTLRPEETEAIARHVLDTAAAHRSARTP